jgi:hypothetical protein
LYEASTIASKYYPGDSPVDDAQLIEDIDALLEQYNVYVEHRAKAGGPEEFRMETTHVDRSKQDESLFVPPADYQKFSMGGGMSDALKGLIPGR